MSREYTHDQEAAESHMENIQQRLNSLITSTNILAGQYYDLHQHTKLAYTNSALERLNDAKELLSQCRRAA